MKRLAHLTTLYFCLTMLVAGCKRNAPMPLCQAAEVVSQDCETGWYILKLEKNSGEAESKGRYIGQLQGGYVTTDNLPEAYRKIGTKVMLRLELNGAYGPTCHATSMMYLAVRVVDTCNGETASRN